jgi:stage III sporulation protein AF
MDTLRIMVRSLLVIIFIAAFLEIVLPRSDMKRYINLIIGLFVIVVVLNPILAAVDKGISVELPQVVTGETAETTSALLKKGSQLGSNMRKNAVKEYKEKLAGQVMALAGFNKSITVTKVEIDMVEDTADSGYGQINKILVYTDSKAGKTKDVVVEDISTAQTLSGSMDFKDLRDMLAGFYGLKQEQVLIVNGR